MIERESHIKELYDMRHRKDKIEPGFDYENNLYKRILSPVLFRNENLASYLEQLQKLSVWMIESVTVLRNFFNFTVNKYYDRHNN